MNVKKPHGKTEYKTLTAKILSMQKGNESFEEVGTRYKSFNRNISGSFSYQSDFLTGCMVSTKGKLPEITHTIKLKSKFFGETFGLKDQKKIEPIKTKELLMLSINTTITVGVVEKISGDEIELSLNIPVVTLKGDKAGIARNIDGHWRLIGWGEII